MYVDWNAVFFYISCCNAKKWRWPIVLFVPVCFVSNPRVGLGSSAFLSALLAYPSLSVTHMSARVSGSSGAPPPPPHVAPDAS